MCINNKYGETLTEPTEIMQRWNEYGTTLFKSDNPHDQYTIPIMQPKEPAPLLNEVEEAIKQLKNGKSPGLDGIPAEIIKYSNSMATKALHKLCNKIWDSCEWPEEWKRQEFVMLHKSGNTKDCSNYRTIALISHASKVLLIIILNRIKAKIEQELPDSQAGFRSNRGTTDMLFTIQILIEKTRQTNQEAFITFIDYSKAFDNVDHLCLLNTMLTMGFPEHIVILIKSLYTNQKGIVRWCGQHCDPFPINKGVRQGCILSPSLFSIYTEQVMRNAEIEDLGISIGGRKHSNMRYADDTALAETTFSNAKELLSKVDRAGKEANLKLNAKKTKIMHIGQQQNENLYIEEEPLEYVKEFKYLGSIKSSNGSCSSDIRARIGMAKQRMIQLKNIWRDWAISKRLKLQLLKALVWPAMCYGCEAWTLKKEDENKINAAEMWFYRRLLRVSWTAKRTNKSILEELNTDRVLLSTIRERKMKYLGHAIRHANCQLMKNIVQGKTEARRKRGRPPRSYMDNIRDWTGLSTPKIYHACEDRIRWRKKVKSAAAAANIIDDADR